jgi:hypothetical protein
MENKKLANTLLQLALKRGALKCMDPEQQVELSLFLSCSTIEKVREENGRRISKQ